MKIDSVPTRAYRQTARAEASAATSARIVDVFFTKLCQSWFDEIRLEEVANEADVTVQTVIRKFGGKEGLLEACRSRVSVEVMEGRRSPVGDVGAAIKVVVADYEQRGDFVMRMLAQEDRYAPIRKMTDYGRSIHRAWIGEVFEPWLSRLDRGARQVVHDRLVIALDIYVWKLIRIDMGRSEDELRQTMRMLCSAALGIAPETL